MRFAPFCKLLLLAGALLFGSAPHLLAQEYPAREIRTICPFAPGTGADIVVRFYANKLAEIAGKPVITENKRGRAGPARNRSRRACQAGRLHDRHQPDRIHAGGGAAYLQDSSHSIRSKTSSSAAR